ncbi:MAG: thioredoxin fold domain-containing protein [Chromatiales bacterium]|jgi:thioredoxin-related protein|nr:thioredoxin fold domain-containing protein [Chromatiales bacterium]MDH4029581.1 thioredoxin fold domain-containing protein [Chromatiales bacterium]
MLRLNSAVVAGALMLALSACDRDTGGDGRAAAPPGAPETTEQAHAAPAGEPSIDWFDGDVDAAFALAKSEDKPLFLYWGAEWCPPCHQIKDQIFSKLEFIEKSRLFVPVYLDGDTERAQKLGDQFGVVGYPTIIVFSADGKELTRIPGGLDIGLYAEVLDLTLQGVRPVAEIVTAVVAGESVSDDDYRLLGFYSWSQDNDRALAGMDKVQAFDAMATSCPASLAAASARLYAEYLRAALEAEKDEEDPRPMSAAQRTLALERVHVILADDDLSAASFPLLIGYADDIVPGLTEAGSAERDGLVSAWNARLDEIAADPDTSPADMLWTRYVVLQFAKLDSDDEGLPDTDVTAAKDAVDQANVEATTTYQRQAFMNAAWYVLTESGQQEYVKTLLLEELEKSKQPYYFMPSLARLAEDDGDTEKALYWLRKGYDTSSGSATRFQWGYYYVDGLIRMTPEEPEAIAQASTQLLSELDGQPDAIYNRTGRIMKRLGTKLAEWNFDGRYDEQIAAIQLKVDALCAQIPDGDASLSTCQIFMEEA